MNNLNKPAFPILNELRGIDFDAAGVFNKYEAFTSGGLTKREYFATMAMQGILGNSQYSTLAPAVAIEAVSYANALLKELEKNND